jgi:8-oxo-dGTP pyrophosphatase MutT (NUDIX family)
MRRVFTKGVVKSLQFYWRRTRGLTMGAQALVLDSHGRILLIRHTYRPGWHFPGGGVEKGEAVDTALKRELEEETGVICDEAPQLFGIYTNFQAFPSDHVVLFVVKQWHQDAIPAPNHEIAEQRFVAPDELPDGTVGAVHRRIDELLHGADRLPNW